MNLIAASFEMCFETCHIEGNFVNFVCASEGLVENVLVVSIHWDIKRTRAHKVGVASWEQNHMSEMFAFHATMMSSTLGTSILVFTRTGFMAMLLSHYRPAGTVFAFTNE